MNKLTFAGACLLVSLLFISCQKETSQEDIQPGSGGSGGSANSGTYYPLTEGTWWKYKDSVSGGIIQQQATKVTKTINGIIHTGLIGSLNGVQSPDSAWAAVDGPDYYSTAEGVSPNTGASFDLLFHYLNDTASVGYNWEYEAGHGNGLTAYIKTTIRERNITMTVSGKSYQNVIYTTMDLSYDIFGTIMDFGTYHYYTAKNIGVIKVISEFWGGGITFKSSTDLIDYQIR